MIPIGDQAAGRWRNILPALGISADFLSGKHGPCPMCEGKDRWRFDDKDGRGTWFCTKCGAGDGVKLVMLKLGIDFKAASAEIAKLVGSAPQEPKKRQRTVEQKREMLKRVWAGAGCVGVATPAAEYLFRRCGLLFGDEGRELRYAERCAYKDGDATSFHPALLARVRAADGKPVNIHRTYLSADGRKADLPEPKRTMEGTLPPGCAVRLGGVAYEMGVAEGIETALSCSRMFGLPVWSTLNATLLQQWKPPAECRCVHIFGDADASFTGQFAAYALGKRLAHEGLDVRVSIPGGELDTDWNDVHRDMREAAE